MSGRLTSDKVAQDRLKVRSYIDTTRKHGINVTTALYRPVTGNPWRPAHPTPT